MHESISKYSVSPGIHLALLSGPLYYIMIKGSIQEEDITIINIYAPNTGALQYVRQMLTSMKGEINNNEIIVGDFYTPLTPMDRSFKPGGNGKTYLK